LRTAFKFPSCCFTKSIDLVGTFLCRCVWRWSSPLATFEAVKGTCFGTLVGTMKRPCDLSALKCWWWVWRLCHYGVDAVCDGREHHVDSGCR
jgi:hypothetical protein